MDTLLNVGRHYALAMMKASYSLAIAFCLSVAYLAHGASDFKLEPNATLRLEFPDLPDTLETLASGER